VVAAGFDAPGATFRVGARIRTRRGPLNGGGKLTCAHGRITLTVGRLTRLLSPFSEVVHTGADVTLLKIRLMPPWCDTALLLQDGDAWAYAVTWFGARGRLRSALIEAGFSVHESTKWLVSLAPERSP
jgi:hypothetical protein